MLFEMRKLRPALCSALRIQLADAAQVRCVPDKFGPDLPARIAGASNVVRTSQGRLGIFLERDPNPGQVRMYIVAARKDEAVIAIERIQDRPEPDVDRSLAIKVRDALDVLTRAVLPAPQTASQSSAVPSQSSAASSQSSAPAPPSLLVGVVAPRPVNDANDNVRSASPLPWAAVLEAGGGALFGRPRTRGAGRVLAGGRYNSKVWSAELTVGARIHGTVSQKSTAGAVDEGEWGPELSLRWLWRKSRVEVGVFGEAMWLRMDARGTTRTGERGSKHQGSLTSSLGLDARVRLFSSAFLRVAPGLEVFSVEQRFAVDDRVTMTLGRTRVLLPLSFLVALPIGGQ